MKTNLPPPATEKSALSLITSLKVTNCFDLDNLKQLVLDETTESHLYTEGAFLARRDGYFELYFGVKDSTELKSAIHKLLSHSLIQWPVKTVLVGRKPNIEILSATFQDLGFTLLKRQARFLINDANDNRARLADAADTNTDEDITVEVAKSSEVNDVFSVLSESFDYYKDNLPELDEIAENIRKQQVIVMKDRGEIIGCSYFEIRNNIVFSLFVSVKKEYKNRLLSYRMQDFIKDFFVANHIQPVRKYGWRDIDNKKLMTLAKIRNEKPDGIYLYNLLYKP